MNVIPLHFIPCICYSSTSGARIHSRLLPFKYSVYFAPFLPFFHYHHPMHSFSIKNQSPFLSYHRIRRQFRRTLFLLALSLLWFKRALTSSIHYYCSICSRPSVFHHSSSLVSTVSGNPSYPSSSNFIKYWSITTVLLLFALSVSSISLTFSFCRNFSVLSKSKFWSSQPFLHKSCFASLR